MQIRGAITHEVLRWRDRKNRPYDDGDIQFSADTKLTLNAELSSPPNAEQLAIIREHCLSNPEGILLDVYQAVTELELRYPSGTTEARERYAKGLWGEAIELAEELKRAQAEHPYSDITRVADGLGDLWLVSVLDHNRLRFNDISDEQKERCLGEMGDILWYASRLAAEANSDLSACFMAFLRDSDAGILRPLYDLGDSEEIDARAKSILDFRLVQDISLSQKLAYTQHISEGTSHRRTATIDSAPYILLKRIIDDELSKIKKAPTLSHDLKELFPHIDITIGKLVWFVAYTANSMLNADFATVMQANLRKVTERSERGTIFSRKDRDEADEVHIKGGLSPRLPVSLRHLFREA